MANEPGLAVSLQVPDENSYFVLSNVLNVRLPLKSYCQELRMPVSTAVVAVRAASEAWAAG